MLSIDAVQQANSGHPGLPMGAATMAYILWTRHLRHNPRNPSWPDRDRFVLSAGHGSMLLYSLLFLTGYDLTLEDLQRFRQWQSRTPGHPERGVTPGVEVTELRTYDERSGLWNPFRPGDRDSIFHLAREQLVTTAGELDIRTHAEESARQLLRALVAADGYVTEIAFGDGPPHRD